MVRTYSRRSMLATAFLPVVAPSFEPAPVAPIASRAFKLGGYDLRLEFRPDGSRAVGPDVLGHIQAQGGGLFAIYDATSAERRAAIARYEAGARDDETVNVAFAV